MSAPKTFGQTRKDGFVVAERKPFDQIPRTTLRDKRLSYRARGVLARLLSNVDGYSMTAADLAREGKEGRDAILTALRELRRLGYILMFKVRDEHGCYYTKNYVYETPQPIPKNAIVTPKRKRATEKKGPENTEPKKIKSERLEENDHQDVDPPASGDQNNEEPQSYLLIENDRISQLSDPGTGLCHKSRRANAKKAGKARSVGQSKGPAFRPAPCLLITCFCRVWDLRAKRRSPCAQHYLTISAAPAPTVRPPSRMAKRRPFSIATGGGAASIRRFTLSPASPSPCLPAASPIRSRPWCGSRTRDGSR